MRKLNYVLIVALLAIHLIGIFASIPDDDDGYDDASDCKVCRNVVRQFVAECRRNASRGELHSFAMDLCRNYTGLSAMNCEKIIDQQIDAAFYIIDQTQDFDIARVCAIYLQNKFCSYPNRTDWSIRLPKRPKRTTKKRYPGGKPLKILHLTDVHFDEKYAPGSSMRCGDSLCCRNATDIPANPTLAAGYWGSYGVCDIPWHTVEKTLTHIKSTHKDIDFVYFTGDIMSHAKFETSVERNSEQLTKFYRAMKLAFGRVPVYPVLGNNEPYPPHFYPPLTVNQGNSLKWLFDLTAREWSKWFQSPSTQRTLRNGGYYTVLLRPGHRLIALNNNVCLISNLWLIYDDRDPYDQLKWLVDVLHRAERAGERVHIIGHMELGDLLTYPICSREMLRIIRRFADTITVHINGHMHLDEFRLVYDEGGREAIAYGLTGGSLTTHTGLNPSYRIYAVDSGTFEVIDYDQYAINVTEANLRPDRPPVWRKLYAFRQEYNLTRVAPKTLEQLYKRMTGDTDLLTHYFQNQIRRSDVYANVCRDPRCLKDILCRTAYTEYDAALKCFSE